MTAEQAREVKNQHLFDIISKYARKGYDMIEMDLDNEEIDLLRSKGYTVTCYEEIDWAFGEDEYHYRVRWNGDSSNDGKAYDPDDDD